MFILIFLILTNVFPLNSKDIGPNAVATQYPEKKIERGHGSMLLKV
jgi:hypothetical protein